VNLLDATLLSAVEGITEFLPISSTGHLILTSNILSIKQTDFVKSFEIFIQLGAVSSVIFLYARDILSKSHLWKATLTAFLPTAVIGLVMYKIIKDFLIGNSAVTLTALFVGGLGLIAAELWLSKKKTSTQEVSEIGLKIAFGIGLIQSVSVIPGVSRSAASIIGGMILGVNRKTATEFSFILAIPTMLAATSLDLFKSGLSFTNQELLILALGFAGSFLVALLSVKFLLGYVRNHSFIPFGIYRIALAIIYFLFVFRH
jgi:undecaprenyl-diphosphatase